MPRQEIYWRRRGVPICTDCSNYPSAGARCRGCQDIRNDQKKVLHLRRLGKFKGVSKTLAERAEALALSREEVMKGIYARRDELARERAQRMKQ